MTETYDVTIPVLVAISQLPGACFWRQNCGLFLTLDGKRHVHATSQDGLGDIMGAYFGRPVCVETKPRRGKQRKSQVIFQKNWERAGGVYIIARSPEEAVGALLAL